MAPWFRASCKYETQVPYDPCEECAQWRTSKWQVDVNYHRNLVFLGGCFKRVVCVDAITITVCSSLVSLEMVVHSSSITPQTNSRLTQARTPHCAPNALSIRRQHHDSTLARHPTHTESWNTHLKCTTSKTQRHTASTSICVALERSVMPWGCLLRPVE